MDLQLEQRADIEFCHTWKISRGELSPVQSLKMFQKLTRHWTAPISALLEATNATPNTSPGSVRHCRRLVEAFQESPFVVFPSSTENARVVYCMSKFLLAPTTRTCTHTLQDDRNLEPFDHTL